MAPIILENDLLKATFAEDNGALLELVGKTTGWRIQNRPELALSFRLLAPLPGRRNNPVRGEKQKLSAYELSADGRELTLTWSGLESEHGGRLEIVFRGTVSLSDQGLTFGGELINHSPYPVENLSYPCIGDLAVPSASEPLFRMRQTYAGMEKTPLLPKFFGRWDYFGFDHPFDMIASPDTPFVLLGSERQGLYAASHDTSQQESVQFAFELKPGFEMAFNSGQGMMAPTPEVDGLANHLEFAVCHFPFAAPGEAMQLSPVMLAPYVGSWHKGADVYKTWRATWFKRPNTPAWARDVHSWQQIQMNSSEDDLRYSYKELVGFGELCARHGIKAIQLVGWNDGGQDRNNPFHDTDPRLGTWEELREAIAKVQEMGVQVILFNKYTWADRHTEAYKTDLVRLAAKDPYGDTYYHPGFQYETITQLAGINSRRFSPMCHLSEEYRQVCQREFHKSVDLGAAGILYDECQHHGGVRYCFDPSHGHHVPGHIYGGDAPLMNEFREISDKANPDFLYAGEACYDQEYQFYNISYFRIGKEHVPWERYVDPFAGIMTAIIGFNDRDQINQCLMYRYIISYEPYNFKGRLELFPRTLEYGRKIDALRRQYREYLWEAEYRDTQEARVTVEAKPHTGYTVFRHPETGKHAVVVANREGEAAINVVVEIEGGTSQMMVATPENPEARPTDGRLAIPPYSVAVVMEQ